MEPYCKDKPQATDCVLNCVTAFCDDLITSRKAANDPILDADKDKEIEICVRSVSLGPCVANPTGLACKSNKFAGIRYPVPNDGGRGSSKVKRVERTKENADAIALLRAMLPEEKAKQHPFEELAIGLIKWMMNEFISLAKMVWAAKSSIACVALANMLGGRVGAVAWCVKTFKGDVRKVSHAWHEEDAIAYSNRIQRAGKVVGIVISTLLAIEDAYLAMKYLGPKAFLAIRGLFRAPKAIEAVYEGGKVVKGFAVIAEGKADGSGMMEITKLGPEGEHVPFASEEEANMAIDQTLREGFENCVQSAVAAAARRGLDKRGKFLDCFGGKKAPVACISARIACAARSHVVEAEREPYDAGASSSSSSSQTPQAPQARGRQRWYEPPTYPLNNGHRLGTFLDDTVTLTEESKIWRPDYFKEERCARLLHARYKEFVEEGIETLPTYGDGVAEWAEAADFSYRRGRLDRKALQKRQYLINDYLVRHPEQSPAISAAEEKALTAYIEDKFIDPERLFDLPIRQPEYSGICEVRTMLSQETRDMLLNGKPAKRPYGLPPGTYDVSDLIWNEGYQAPGKPLTPNMMGEVPPIPVPNITPRMIMKARPGLLYNRVPTTTVAAETRFVIRSTQGKWMTPFLNGDPELWFVNEWCGSFKLVGYAKGTSRDVEVFYFDNVWSMGQQNEFPKGLESPDPDPIDFPQPGDYREPINEYWIGQDWVDAQPPPAGTPPGR